MIYGATLYDDDDDDDDDDAGSRMALKLASGWNWLGALLPRRG